MGILELHFHDSKFDFSPSMGDSSGESEESAGSMGWRSSSGSEDTEAESESSGPGAGALVGLVVLVGLAALVGMKRRGGSEESEDVTLEA